jgi:hypothetical protein
MEFIKKLGFSKTMYIVFLAMTAALGVMSYNNMNFPGVIYLGISYLIIILTVFATSLITTFTNLTRLSKYELIQRMGRCLFYFVAISFFLGTLKIMFHPETFNLNKLLLKGGKLAFVLVFADIIFVKKKKDVLA